MKRVIWLTLGFCTIGNSAFGFLGEQIGTLVPDVPVSNQDFSDALAMHGDLSLVGAENTAGDAGAAYLIDAVTGATLHTITAADTPAAREFGGAVNLDGGHIVIGAVKESSSKGSAYIFDLNGTQLHKLTAADGAANHEFGNAVAISGNRALVGAPGSAGFRGQAYLYDVTTGMQIGAPLKPADLPGFAEFGNSLAMDGERAIVGIDLTGRGGAAYIFDSNGNQLHKLTPPIDSMTMQPVRGFGRAVSISGNVAIVGATPSDVQALPGEHGRAYLFDVTTGAQLFELTPDDSTGQDLFSDAVAISGNLALVTARHADLLFTPNKAYLFDVATGQQIATLMPEEIPPDDEALESIAISGGRALGGYEGYDSPGFANNGTALIFDVLAGDYNDNGIVDAADYTVWRNAKSQIVSAFSGADGNGDTLVDDADFNLWKANYGVAAPGALTPGSGGIAGRAGSVPEPANATLLLVALITLSLGRRNPA